MTALSLPVIDPARTEFGLARTVCACAACTVYCRHMPGYLIPADLERIHQHLSPGEDLVAWVRRHQLASPGALVLRRGLPMRIPTLVPARRLGGACVFLTDAAKCAIHAAAPFGCAFFDSHMPKAEADQRSMRGLQAIMDAWNSSDAYARLWVALADDGFVADAPEVARQHFQQPRANELPR